VAEEQIAFRPQIK